MTKDSAWKADRLELARQAAELAEQVKPLIATASTLYAATLEEAHYEDFHDLRHAFLRLRSPITRIVTADADFLTVSDAARIGDLVEAACKTSG